MASMGGAILEEIGRNGIAANALYPRPPAPCVNFMRNQIARLLSTLLSACCSHGPRPRACNRAKCTSGRCRRSRSRPRAQYANPYVDVECWVELEGPDFKRRVYGFWDGGRTFKVRIVATHPGEWSWRVGANRADDAGLTGAGKFRAVAWSDSRARRKSQPPRLRARDRQRPCAALRGWHAVFSHRRHLARGVHLAVAIQGHARRRGLCAGRRHQLRRGRGLAQAPGFQLRLVHRRVSELGRR